MEEGIKRWTHGTLGYLRARVASPAVPCAGSDRAAGTLQRAYERRESSELCLCLCVLQSNKAAAQAPAHLGHSGVNPVGVPDY
jgi:hypothetical protein